MTPIVSWTCYKCKKPNSYGSTRDENQSLIMEMKINLHSRPKKKVAVKCSHCNEKQAIMVEED